jgi:hypothetical protein
MHNKHILILTYRHRMIKREFQTGLILLYCSVIILYIDIVFVNQPKNFRLYKTLHLLDRKARLRR